MALPVLTHAKSKVAFT